MLSEKHCFKTYLFIILTAVFLFSFSGCGYPDKAPYIPDEPTVKKKAVLTRISYAQHPLFTDDMLYDGLEYSIIQSLVYLNRIPLDRTFRFGKDIYKADHMIKSLEMFQDFIRTNPSRHELRDFVKTNYLVYRYNSFKTDIETIYEELEQEVIRSISFLKNEPSDRTFAFGDEDFKAGRMAKALKKFLKFLQKKPPTEHLLKHISTHHLVNKYFENGLPVRVLYTGYYEPFLVGSLKKDSKFRFPIYTLPNDLSVIDLSPFGERFDGEKIVGRFTDDPGFVPYYSRKEIEAGSIPEEKAKPLAWVNSKVDLFFLEVQGSGTIYLNNGQTIKVHYHNSNGRPYRSGNYFF